MRIRLHHMKRSFGGSKMGKCWQFLVVRPIRGKNLAPYQNAAKAPSSSGRFLPHCTDRVVRVRAAGKYGGHEGGWARNAERSLRGDDVSRNPAACQSWSQPPCLHFKATSQPPTHMQWVLRISLKLPQRGRSCLPI